MSMGKVLFGIERKIFNLIKEGADLCTKGASQAEIDEHWKKVDRVGKSTNEDAVVEAKNQIEARLKKYLSTTTMTALQIERELQRYWSTLRIEARFAERGRILFNDPNYGRETSTFARVLQIAGGLIVGGWFVIGLATNNSRPAPSLQQQQIEDIRKHADDLHQILLQETTVTTGQFDLMVAPAPMPDEPPLPQAAVPPALAAIEAQPVDIEVVTPEGARTVETTVGQLYRSAPPQVREQMEAPKIDHGYDHDDPNGCFRRHCLSPHKDLDITADFDRGGVQHAIIHY